jgi:hypothetical protein
MSAATLFGIALAPLYAAIAEVESMDGRVSNNVYQLRILYVHDVNRITYNAYGFREADRYERQQSERMMYEYWRHYGERYRQITGRQPTAEVLARIHNGGPDGWCKRATLPYWRRIEAAMDSAASAAARVPTDELTADGGRPPPSAQGRGHLSPALTRDARARRPRNRADYH